MHNALKAKLAAGQPAYGVSIMIPSPQAVEMVARLGFDWVLLDGEHGALGPESFELLAMAAEAAGITPIARPLASTPELIGQALDRGALGVQAPHVRTADDARRVVRAARFHPLGERSLAVGTRASRYGLGLTPAEYAAQAGAETLVAVQIEDADALLNLDAILAVEGVDVYFIGPSDLSQALGYPGQADAPPVRLAIETTLARIQAAGRVAGIAAGAGALRRYRDLGARYLYTHLTRLLEDGARAFRQAMG